MVHGGGGGGDCECDSEVGVGGGEVGASWRATHSSGTLERVKPIIGTGCSRTIGRPRR